MKVINRRFRRKLSKSFTLFFGIVLVLNMSFSGVFFIPLPTSATDVGSINEECRDNNFDFGIAKWECDNEECEGDVWSLVQEISSGTSVVGSCSEADWDGGPTNTAGIVVKAGQNSTVYYGSSGNITQGDHAFSHVTFCGNEREEPECGDGNLDDGEECDDGNNENRDGCSAACELEIPDCVDADYEFEVDMGVVGENCHQSNKTDDSTSIDVPVGARYSVNGQVWRGSPGQCQTHEDFFLEVNGENGPETTDDAEPCAQSVRMDYLGEFDFNSGLNDVLMHTAAECPPDDSANSVDLKKLCLSYIPECGNSILDEGEQCDDGNNENGDGCSADCTEEGGGPYCGDGVVNQEGEECDDGNNEDGDGCSAECQIELCEIDLDVVFIMDRSGSMGWDNPTRLSQAQTAANTFAGILRTGDQSALVSYSTTATLDKTLDNNHGNTQTAINALSASGATNIGDAIDLATGENTSVRANPQAAQIQILLTDGKANKPNGPGHGEDPADVAYAIAESVQAAAAGIKIFTIGLGSEVNEAMLQTIASNTGGQYYNAPTGEDLNNIFNQIAYDICDYGSISGCKYLDSDNDGSIDGESTLSGWEIQLQGSNGPISQFTDEQGCYIFAGLLAGNYNVSEIGQAGYIQTYPTSPNYYDVLLAEGENTGAIDFANYMMECGNGIQDEGEQCDDGDNNGIPCEPPYDGSCFYCSNECELIELFDGYCGDGILHIEEECDGEAGVGEHQECSPECTLIDLTYCGDNIKQTPNDEGTGGPQDDGNEECDGQDGVSENQTCTEDCILENIICEVDLDVVFIMDRSGSMGWDDPTRLLQAQTAANTFAGKLRTGDQSALVSYSTTATLDKTLDNNHGNTQTAINALSAGGATNIGDAIDLATGENTSVRANPQAAQIQILLTDGKANKPNGPGWGEDQDDVDYAIAESVQAAANGIIIFTIGLGSNINEAMLQTIASNTGGQYYNAPTGEDLDNIFNQIAYDICDYGSISGCKYLDSDNDGSIDGESTLSGWEITLQGSNGPISQFTDEQGCYIFAGLLPDNYNVSEIMQPEYFQTYPTDPSYYDIALGNNQDINNIDFGNYLPYCGNEILDEGEQCDDGNNENGDGCSAECTEESGGPYCGDGVVNQEGEKCDDGNNEDGDGCSAECQIELCGIDLDVVFIMDRSGSMGWDNPTRLSQAQTAANTFAGILRTGDQSALVSYSTTATLDKTLDNNHGNTQTAINALSASGATNIGDAIDLATGENTSVRANPQAAQIQILLTDGKANKPNGPGHGEDQDDVDYAIAESVQAAAAGIKIFTIGLGSEVNEAMLQTIASNTGGQYYNAPTGEDLNNIFNQIAYDICDYGSISGCKYLDSDNDSSIDGEITLSGWEIQLQGSNGPISQFTDEQGCYSFAGLLAGNYNVSEIGEIGYIQTYPFNPNYYELLLAEGEDITQIDFANYLPICGNGIQDEGEGCDDGDNNGIPCDPPYDGSCFYCSDICEEIEIPGPYCGDGVINGQEECDGEAGVGEYQTCSNECTLIDLTYCGDNIKQTPNDEGTGGPQDDGNEECDGQEGLPDEHYTCNPDCTLEYIPYCGDGNQDDGEECDDGEGNGIVCDPDYGSSCNYCSNECEEVILDGPFCGDGIKNGDEQCDGEDGVGENQICTEQCILEDIICEVDLDVVFIMDRSGSMGWDNPTRLSQAQTAANTFAGKLRTGDQSALVSYSTTATLDKTLDNNHGNTQTAINALSASGATNIGDAIDLATGENTSVRANPQAAQIQILLTDGKANKPNGPGHGEDPADVAYAIAESVQAAANGIIIFTIGLGSDVNEAMLQTIASTTGGQYYNAPTGDDLDNIFNQIAYEICEYGSISGCKYLDSDNDGSIDGESTLSGWEIQLEGSNGPISQFTDEHGCYIFAGLLAGNYNISEIGQVGYIQTYPTSPSYYDILLAEGENTGAKDFANYMMECGNSILDEGEQCDDGLDNGQVCDPPYGGSCNYCSNICTNIELIGPFCGDEIKNGDEECDGQDGVGEHQTCSNECTLIDLTYCGDNIKQTPNDEGTGGPQDDGNEECDGQDGVGEHQTCTLECTLEDVPYCGDGNQDDGEECDDGESNGEVCAPPYGGSCNYCSNICTDIELDGPFCGDEVINGNEECDDGNNQDGDGCSAICESEPIIEIDSIIINEIMQNPDAVSDTNGEWFEVYNASSSPINLQGCVISDNGTNSHAISSSLVVPAQGYAVLGRNSATSTNGNYDPDYVYGGSFTLGNTDDEVIITCNSTIIDIVAYDGGPNFPNPTGASMILNSPFNDNNVGSNWCVSVSSFGDGDLGTPGAPNDSCGEEPYCGDGIQNGEEECDGEDGVGEHQFCSEICLLIDMTYCGDGIKQSPNDEWTGGPENNGYEECDGSDGVPAHYTCNQECTLVYVPYCGDNNVDSGEQCDDGNTNSGDGCSSTCQNEGGGGAVIIITGVGGGPAPIVLGEEGEPVLTIDKQVNIEFANPGDEAEYTVDITNNGNLTAFDVNLSDMLPTGFTFADDGGTNKALYIGDIAPGETKTVSYKVNISEESADGIYANLAEASASNHDPVVDTTNIEVRAVEVLGVELAPTGFSIKEFLLILASIALLIGLTAVMKRKYKHNS